MRGVGVAWAVFLALATFHAAQATVLPPADPSFEAEVIGTGVFALAGPGSSFYPTGMLREGQIVTVSGPQKDNWVAILPPIGSVSWIEANRVKENSDGTATVSTDQTNVYVGSTLSEARHVWQVVLSRGDVVHIVDEAFVDGQGTKERWFKILPPAGEHRYVPASAIRVLQTGAPLATSTSSSPTTATSNSGQAPAASTPSGAPVATNLLPVSARVGTRIIPAAQPLQRSKDQWTGEAVSVPTTVAKTPIVDDSSKSLADRIDSVRNQLTQMRTRLPEQWDLDSARSAIDSLTKAAKTPTDQAAVQTLSDSEKHMRQLWDRYHSISERREVFLQQDRELSIMLKRAMQSTGDFVPNYDAEGTLRRATVKIDGATTYVLEDAAGEPTYYVNFPPGLSGEGYVGRQVGLLGQVSRRDHVPIPRIVVDQVASVD